MILEYHPNFKKQYKKLPQTQKKRFAAALKVFSVQPYHPSLYNHPLKGNWKGHRSVSFGGDWRAHYVPISKNIAFFVAIGTHSQLYK